MRNFELGDVIQIRTAANQLIDAIVTKAELGSDDVTVFTTDKVYIDMIGVQKLATKKVNF